MKRLSSHRTAFHIPKLSSFYLEANSISGKLENGFLEDLNALVYQVGRGCNSSFQPLSLRTPPQRLPALRPPTPRRIGNDKSLRLHYITLHVVWLGNLQSRPTKALSKIYFAKLILKACLVKIQRDLSYLYTRSCLELICFTVCQQCSPFHVRLTTPNSWCL